MIRLSIKLELEVDVSSTFVTLEEAAKFDVDDFMRKKTIPALKKAGVIEDWLDGKAELMGVFKT